MNRVQELIERQEESGARIGNFKEVMALKWILAEMEQQQVDAMEGITQGFKAHYAG